MQPARELMEATRDMNGGFAQGYVRVVCNKSRPNEASSSRRSEDLSVWHGNPRYGLL